MDRERQKLFAEVVREYNARNARRILPHIELLRDGREIAGEWCQFTMGVIVLLEATRNPLFITESGDEPTVMDVAEAYWLMQPRHVDKAVWMVSDGSCKKAVERYAQSLGHSGRAQMCDDLSAWIWDILDALPPARESDGDIGDDRRSDWYMDALDMIASEYGWDEHYIMWELPWARNVRLREALIARRNGKPIVDDYSDEIDAMMQAAAKVVKDG